MIIKVNCIYLNEFKEQIKNFIKKFTQMLSYYLTGGCVVIVTLLLTSTKVSQVTTCLNRNVVHMLSAQWRHRAGRDGGRSLCYRGGKLNNKAPPECFLTGSAFFSGSLQPTPKPDVSQSQRQRYCILAPSSLFDCHGTFKFSNFKRILFNYPNYCTFTISLSICVPNPCIISFNCSFTFLN